MQSRTQRKFNSPATRRACLFLGLGFFLLLGRAALAQSPASHLVITKSDSSSAPTFTLQVYGVDNQGLWLDLAATPLTIRHAGVDVPADRIQVAGSVEEGTFTLFVLDLTEGVSPDIPRIQQAIQQYAADPKMKEQVDYVAIYQVGEAAASVILEPTTFRNSVLNVFVEKPLTPVAGTTALVDTLLGLLNSLTQQKPRPELFTSLVVFSDGTDVDSQGAKGDVPQRAAELGVPIHTFWLDNPNIQLQESKDEGRNYLNNISQGTRGVPLSLSASSEEIDTLWNRLAAFRTQTRITYSIDNPVGGEQPVELSVGNNAAVRATTTVTVPPGAPSVVLEIPADSRALTLTDPSQPIELSLATTVTWLDGVERAISRAVLVVNGVETQEIDVSQLDRFTTSVVLGVGPNTIQVAVIDDQGSRARSPEITLTVTQGGETVLPPAVQPPGLFESLSQRFGTVWRYAGTCLLVLLALAVLILLGLLARRAPMLRSLIYSVLVRIPFLREYLGEARQIQNVGRQLQGGRRQFARHVPEARGLSERKVAPAFLEVLESVTRMASPRIELDAPELTIGRSPQQAVIVFENDVTVSRKHATISQEGHDYRIFDEQSTGGTWVNGQKVMEAGLQLMDGDEIRLGAVRLRFRQP
ncbi:MAG: FHA domain-containing protein [Chloroflexota bacterium]